MNLSFAEFRRAIALMQEQGMVHPNFAISLGDKPWINPSRRPHHWKEWPLPVYHNDNEF
jgi:hypothetical protein